ncbi:MAG: DNA-protecting protein DprA [Calothrix sp. FI2-JRJ7]|jgi:predicted Rossmann fold nucleotide-binding protein DprA/Smf involved in DNA uptake|nr:DNA-protecting protein DprA [Calothrix sp. FI2-JRJ7]
MFNHVLAPDTQAILLLCGSFGQNRLERPQPLTLSEYNSLAEWLRENQMRPADLLAPTTEENLQTNYNGKLDINRLLTLLQRGAMLSLAVEKWTNQGLWILGRSDANYPKRLKMQLKQSAPAILYGVGNVELLSMGGLAIVGSRDIDEEGLNYTQKIAQTCSAQSIQVISGGARGVDQAAMLGALNAGGTAIGVLADSLVKAAVNTKYRPDIKDGRLLLVSSYDPEAGFNTGNAMGRNKYIYALADYALVVNSTVGKGGTWAGATEALSKFKDIPVFVRLDNTAPEGNQELYNKGAKPFPAEPWNCLHELLSITQESSNTEDIYEVVLPVILRHLQQPKDAKTLAESLNVRLPQMQDWLNRAEKEGTVSKSKAPVTYVVSQTATQLSLL